MRTSSPAFSKRASSIATSTGRSKIGLFGAILTVGRIGGDGDSGMPVPGRGDYIPPREQGARSGVHALGSKVLRCSRAGGALDDRPVDMTAAVSHTDSD